MEEKNDKYIIAISILVLFLIISTVLNIFGFVLIKDKDEIIEGCGYWYEWKNNNEY